MTTANGVRLRVGMAFLAGVLVTPIVVLCLAVVGWLPADAITQPHAWEASIGGRALDASLSARAKRVTNPVGLDDEIAMKDGAKLYRENCAGCHGEAQRESVWGTKGFYPRVPQFWSRPVSITPPQAYVAIRDGVRYSGMGAWRDLMSEGDMWKVATFVSRMHSLPSAVSGTERAIARR
jgi:mono/diheme cytochrome c family protein